MKKKHDGFKNLGLLAVAALLVGACSPLAPSVSKMSNTAGVKTSPTDGATSPANSTAPGGAFGASKVTLATGQQETQITPVSKFRKEQWNLIHDAKLSLMLGKDHVDDFVTNGTVSFASNEDHVKGVEETLATGKVKIFLVVSGIDSSDITSTGMDQIRTSLKWHPDTARWEISLLSPNTGDAVKDMNDFKQEKDQLQAHLGLIAIEFQPE